MVRSIFVISVICIFLAPMTASAAGPSMHDFAYGVELRTDADLPYYTLKLPQYVYSSVTDPALRDMAVFNAAGEPVMYTLGLPGSPEPEEELVPVPFYPIPARWTGKTDGVELEVVRDDSGSVIRVESRSEPDTPMPKSPEAYLIDTSAIEGPVERFELSWPETENGFMVRALLEYSDDLKSWRATGVRDTVADLTYGSHRFTESSVRALGLAARFYRLSFPAQVPPPMFTGVVSVLAGPGEEPERDTGSAYPTRHEANGYVEFVYDTAGHRPVDHIGLVLPEDNSLVQAEYFSRNSEDGAWIRRASSRAYRFKTGDNVINSPDVKLAPVTDRYWMVRMKSGGGMGSGLPRLAYSWLPHELTFIARGEGPFTLAYASARLTPEKLSATGYMQNMNIGGTGLDAEIEPGSVVPSGRVELGGQAALQPEPPETDWTVYLLWSVLVTGVILLVWMAVGLFRKVDTRTGPPPDNG